MAYDSARETAAKQLTGQRIRDARLAKKMSQVDLATAMRRTQGVVSEWEKGIRRVGVSDAWLLAHVLGTSVGAIFGPPRGATEHQQFNALYTAQRARLASGRDAAKLE